MRLFCNSKRSIDFLTENTVLKRRFHLNVRERFGAPLNEFIFDFLVFRPERSNHFLSICLIFTIKFSQAKFEAIIINVCVLFMQNFCLTFYILSI